MTAAQLEALPERVRCTACAADTSAWMLVSAPFTMGWLLLDGFWFCADHAAAAPYIVALDRERNAHQATILKLETAKETALAAIVRAGEIADAAAVASIHAHDRRLADLDEAAAIYAAMVAEIEALRCGDLGPYFDGRLSTERRDAFCAHLTRCKACEDGLLGLMQEAAVASAPTKTG